MARRLVMAATAAMALLAAAAAPPAPAQAQAQTETPALEPDAMLALNRLGYSLRQLKQFEVTSQARLERAFENSPPLEFRQDTTFLVEMPGRIAVDIATDSTHRKVFYDGKQITVVGLMAAKYINLPMEGTVSEVLRRAYDELGIDFPLQDLFRWGSETAVTDQPSAGFRVGDSMVRGQKVVQYAYQMPEVSFQIWMTEGDRPLPLRMVITEREQPGLRYAADLLWNLTPKIDPASFVYRPRPEDTAVAIEGVTTAIR
ncbi:MAG: DUF2092 domain-containing protein [Polymorphobacter sp.]|uniref:DUF2092 domain-containing protein n=1 Tax=Polymorphobacter sp. TaxID=1909290 RepID=UPI003A8B3294